MKEAYPLSWPDGWKRVARRSRSRFEVSGFGKARDFLLAEIRRMGGTGVILSTNIPLRNDGLPYANSRVGSTRRGIALSPPLGGCSDHANH
jgi:hypothetical protein